MKRLLERTLKIRESSEQARNVARRLADKGFTDGLDVDPAVSLFEYGILRNPKTDEVIYGRRGQGEDPMTDMFDKTKISLRDVQSALEEAPDGFYSAIGSTKEEELKNLSNDNLAPLILSLNQYDGTFNYDADYSWTIYDLIKQMGLSDKEMK